MNKSILLNEAYRCLQCKKPRCRENCPINTPIPEIIALYKEGKKTEAGKILFENNPLSVICSIVCPHENQCEGNCIKGIKGESIKFYEIEKEISDEFLKKTEFEEGEKTKGKVAIIGGGPSGITASLILSAKGYNVTIFDSNEKIGGVLRYGIPEYRLSREYLDLYEEKLIESGVQIRPNTLIGPVISIDRLLEDEYKAVLIATGVWNPNLLNIKGETLGNVHHAIDYLKTPQSYILGKKVAVIGAGNVAMDAARTAKRSGSDEVTIIYRKDFNFMKATTKEIEDAMKDGVYFKILSSPKEITEEGINLHVKNEIESESEEFFKCDSVIISVGQSPKNNIVSNTKEIETDSKGLIITDDSGMTTRKGVFSCGDIVTGANTVVAAVNKAKIVAEAMDKYCKKN